MIELPILNFDCKYFAGDRPCFANKEHKILCDNCNFYEKDENITERFPEIKPFTPLKKIKSILIIKLDATGDVLRTTSLLPTLAKKYPEANVDWITKENSRELLYFA